MNKRGSITIGAIVILVIASISILALLSYINSINKRIFSVLLKTSQTYENRITAESLFNIILSIVMKKLDNTSWKPLSGNCESLLESWKAYIEEMPGESKSWETIYAKIKASGRTKDILESSTFQNLLTALIGDSILPSNVKERTKSCVYRFLDDAGQPIDLIVVNYMDHFFWANRITKTLNQYLFLTNSETTLDNRPIYFITGDVIDGPIYTTDVIHTDGSPIFKGRVEAAGFDSRNGTPVFENGYAIIDPSSEEVFKLDEEFANSVFDSYREDVKNVDEIIDGDTTGILIPFAARIIGKTLSSNTLRMEFYDHLGKVYELDYSIPPDETGTMEATLSRTRGSHYSLRFRFNGIVLGSHYIRLSTPTSPSYFGGLITIASEEDVWIDGNIVYHYLKKDGGFEQEDSKYNELSIDHPKDRLNIVSKGDVVMWRYVPNNLYITASIYALGGQFTLQSYRWIRKDTLHLFGALIQKNRGPVGTFISIGSEVIRLTGFAKKYIYDKRLYVGPYPSKTPQMEGKARVADVR